MSWQTPRTWNPSETVTSYFFNTHVRDQLLTIDTCVQHPVGFTGTAGAGTDNGLRYCNFVNVAMTSDGFSNPAGGADTEATEYTTMLPADLLHENGDALEIWLTAYTTAAAVAKTIKFSPVGLTGVVLFTNSAATAYWWNMRCFMRRRSQTLASITGVAMAHSAASWSGVAVYYLCNSQFSGTVDWTLEQTLKFYVASSTAGAVTLRDVMIRPLLQRDGKGSIV